MHNEDVQEYRRVLEKDDRLTDKERMDLINQYREYVEQLDYDIEFWAMVS